MNWWVIVVGICLNSLHKCLLMFVCWWVLNWCGCLWSLNEKRENCEFWWKKNIMMILMRIDVMIPCLLLFWLSSDVYKLTHKLWGQIWVKEDQNQGFWMKIGWIPERKPKNWVPLCWCSELLSTATHDFGVPGTSGPIQTFLNNSFDVFNCCCAF